MQNLELEIRHVGVINEADSYDVVLILHTSSIVEDLSVVALLCPKIGMGLGRPIIWHGSPRWAPPLIFMKIYPVYQREREEVGPQILGSTACLDQVFWAHRSYKVPHQ